MFDESPDGSITQKSDITSTNEIISHYFGVHMSTRFVQQYGGHNAPNGTAGQREVTYNFSGDDDVWIFIDGVLVGDLGGIHNATSIEINFASGNVVVYEDVNGDYQWDSGRHVYLSELAEEPLWFYRRHLRRQHLSHPRLLLSGARQQRLQHVAQVQPGEHPRD